MQTYLAEKLAGIPALQSVFAPRDGHVLALSDMACPQTVALAAAALLCTKRPVLLITAYEGQAARMADDLDGYLGGKGQSVSLRLPQYLFVRAVADRATEDRAVQALWALRKGEIRALTVPCETLLHTLPAPGAFMGMACSLKTGDVLSTDALCEKLIRAGYFRADMAEGRGQFALRGGIVDVFPVDRENAVRIEFYGDEVDSIRAFDPVSQRSQENLTEVTLPPCRLFFSNGQETAGRIREMVLQALRRLSPDGSGGESASPEPVQDTADSAEDYSFSMRIDQGTGLRRMLEDADEIERYYSTDSLQLYAACAGLDIGSLADFFPSAPLVFIDDPDAVKKRLHERYEGFLRELSQAVETGDTVPETRQAMFTPDAAEERLSGSPVVLCQQFLRLQGNFHFRTGSDHNCFCHVFSRAQHIPAL